MRFGHIVVGVALSVAGIAVASCVPNPAYDVLPPDPEERLGLLIYEDPVTGCQYVSNGHALLPRAQRDGHQVCRSTDEPR